jgi:predicted metal-binding membrane protein
MHQGYESATLDSRAGFGGDRVFLAFIVLLFIASTTETVWLCGTMSGGMAMPGRWTMSMAWMRMPDQSWPGAAAMFMGMWVLMMVAMMLPSLVPTLARSRRTLSDLDATNLGRLTVVVGYFLVWTLFGVIAYPLGLLLAMSEMRTPALAQGVPIASGIVVLLAGCYQFTPWKIRQLACCRVTSGCEDGIAPNGRSALRYGVILGFHCISCCCGFMLILLVTGVMNLVTMTMVGAAITVERLAPRPEIVSRVTGVLVIGAGAVVIIRALGVG